VADGAAAGGLGAAFLEAIAKRADV
jgi:hypothetical protein